MFQTLLQTILTSIHYIFNQQIEDKGNELNTLQRERDGLQRSLDNQQRRIEHARQEVLDQHKREEKIWKTEISACRFKLEAEAKYFKDELARIQVIPSWQAVIKPQPQIKHV